MTIESLEALQFRYENKMKEYIQVSQEYKQVVQSGATTYSQLKDKSINGIPYSTTSTTDINACQAMCSSTTQLPKCSGATFNSNTNQCNLYVGPSRIESSTGMYAIISNIQYLTGKLSEINNQLIELNKQIQNAVATRTENNLDIWGGKTENKNTALISNYNELLTQRDEINSLLVEYNSVNESLKDTTLVTNQQMTTYRLYTILLALLLCLLVVVFGNISINVIIVPLIIAAILFILNLTMFSFAIVVGVVLYYIYSIPME